MRALRPRPDPLPRRRARARAADDLLLTADDHVVAAVGIGVESDVRGAALHPGERPARVLLPRRGGLEQARAAAARVPRDLVAGAEDRRAADADRARARRRVAVARQPERHAVHPDEHRTEGAGVAARREQRLALRLRLLEHVVERRLEAAHLSELLAFTRREARLLRAGVG